MQDLAPEYDAIINLAGIEDQFTSKLSSDDIFDDFDKAICTQTCSNIPLTHMIAKMLAPNGYVAYPAKLQGFYQGSSDAAEKVGDSKAMAPMDYIAHMVTMKQGLDLACDRDMEQVIHQNTCVNMLLFTEDTMVRKKDKYGDPKVLKVKETKLEGIAGLLKHWAGGDARPENGSFVSFDFSQNKKGKIIMPVLH